ncbi:MAG: citramalate synthase, partial [Bdellovibrionota bacterium]
LGVSLEENLDLIHDSIRYLRKHFGEVFYDAEHFFDGYADNPDYALSTLKSAVEGGADVLVLCDTNGGTVTSELRKAVAHVKQHFPKVRLGIHTHNDIELGVANAVAAVEEGARHVQGTINGLGERCGNANLVSIIPTLQLKLGYSCIPDGKLANLRRTSHLIYEFLNVAPSKSQAYVGDSAFAHKGGVHVSAVLKNARTYEHIDPALVGNRRRVLVSDLSGKSNLLYKAREWGLDVDSKTPEIKAILERLKDLEHDGYEYEGAEASFELLMQEALHKKSFQYFRLKGFRVIDEKRKEDEDPVAEAIVEIDVSGQSEASTAQGNGPVAALDRAIRKALEKFYPDAIKDLELLDYKVRVLAGEHGTSSNVRVLIESGDKHGRWGTVGVSHNILEASYKALVDSIRYKLYKDGVKAPSAKRK